MSIRRDPIYISKDVWSALWLLSKKHSDELNKITPDQMADDMLRGALKSSYPQLFEHQKKVEQLEKELLKTL